MKASSVGAARKTTQAEVRRAVEVGPQFGQVTSVTTWYRAGHFTNDEEARGAFKFAHQQALDGMGTSVAQWMGMTDAEFERWMRFEELPKR